MMLPSFACGLPSRVEFGPGKLACLEQMTAGRRVALLSDSGLEQAGVAAAAMAECKKRAAAVTLFTGIPAEPSEDDIQTMAGIFSGSRPDMPDMPDMIVAVGGGSVLDAAKALSLLLGGKASLADMFAGVFPERREIGLVMVPTTAGTGAEATPNAIFYRPSLRLKVGIVTSLFVPDQVILDANLTLGLPPRITAATGLDALCHAVECLISKKANPFSDMLAREAVKLIFANLRAAYRDGSDRAARSAMLLASFYGGVCIASSGTNIVHALSYPLGGRFRIPHGVANAILLAPGMAFNRAAAEDKLASLAPFLPGGARGRAGEDSELVVAELAALAKELGIPSSLTELGVPEAELDELVDAACQVRRLLDNNPVEAGPDDIRRIYLTLFC